MSVLKLLCCQTTSPKTIAPAPSPKRTRVLHTLQGCKLVGVGSSVPKRVLTNFDLEKIVDTSDEWIAQRTGIKQRRLADTEDKLADYAVEATIKALDMANIEASDIDCLLFATSTPDDIFGSATQVQHAIGAKNAAAFDLTCACAGFVVALITAAQYIRSGSFKNIVIVGGDVLSRFVNWRDRSTCILFGDGCGAVVMTGGHVASGCSLLGMAMRSDGGGYQHLNASFEKANDLKAFADEDTASDGAKYSNINLNGQEVFKWAVKGVPEIINLALDDAGLDMTAIDWLIMHQANQRIIDASAKRMGIPQDRVICNVANYGNTSAGSVPLALDEAVRSGQVRSGDVIALAGFGAGLTRAATIIRWD